MATRDKVFAVLSDRIGVSALCAHGYLAVDLFFVLSGAVIAHAYEGRIFSRKLSVGSFVLTRIIRLWPLIALGTFIGACAETLRPGTDMSLHHVAHVAMAMFQSFVLLPDFSNSFMEDAIFPLNGPTWSLFFEIVANLAFIPVMLTRKSWVLAIILSVLSLALLVVSAVSVGGITEGPTHKGFTGGFARVFFSFSIGYLISILDFKLYVRNGRIIAPVLLAAIFIMPLMSQPLELLFNLVSVIIVFPLIICISLNDRGSPEKHNVSRLSGQISYPLYSVHYPLLKVISLFMIRANLATPFRAAAAIVATCLLVGFSKVLFDVYDVPLRRYLTNMSKTNRVITSRITSSN